MAKFVKLGGYIINPDQVVQVQKIYGDVNDDKDKYLIYLSDGRFLTVFCKRYASNVDEVVKTLEMCSESSAISSVE